MICVPGATMATSVPTSASMIAGTMPSNPPTAPFAQPSLISCSATLKPPFCDTKTALLLWRELCTGRIAKATAHKRALMASREKAARALCKVMGGYPASPKPADTTGLRVYPART